MAEEDFELDNALASYVKAVLSQRWRPLSSDELESRCDWISGFTLAEIALWVRNRPKLQHPAVIRALCGRSYNLRLSDPKESHEVAQKALRAAESLPYPASFRALAADLRAEALAHLANSFRLLEQHSEADAAFERCEDQRLEGSGDLLLAGEIFRKRAELRRDQKRPEEAICFQEKAVALLSQASEFHCAGKARLSQAITFFETGDASTALDIAALSAKLLDPRKEPEMTFALMHNTLFFLEAYKLPNATLSLFNRLRPMYGDMDSPLINTRALWLSGRLFFAVGKYKPAAKYSEAARKAFLEHGLAYDAALAGFDSARAWAHLGNTLKVQLIADRMYEVFTDKNIPGEAAKALEIFVDAAQRAEADVAFMARLAEQLAKAPRP